MSSGSTSFNFYELWLGIECASRPDYYQLLGVKPFETDEQKILAAFDSRRDQLRHTSPGQYAEQWRKLADELIAAKRCLLTPAARVAYDEHLRYAKPEIRPKAAEDEELTFADEPPSSPAPATTTGTTKSVAASPPIEALSHLSSEDEIVLGLPELPPAAGETPAFLPQSQTMPAVYVPGPSPVPQSFAPALVRFRGQPSPATPGPAVSPKPSGALAKLEKSRRQSQRNLIGYTLLFGVGAIVALVVVSKVQQEQDKQATKQAVAQAPVADLEKGKSVKSPMPKHPPTVAHPPNAAPTPRRSPFEPPVEPAVPAPMSTPVESPSIKPPPSEPPAVDPQQILQFRAALKSIRTQLARRNIDAALQQAAAAEQLATGDEQKQQAALHRQLVRHTSDFWEAVSDGAAKLNGGDELERDGKPFAIVVESTIGKLMIKADGRNHTYTIPGDINSDVAVAIAGRTIEDPTEEKLLLGAFYAADAAGDFSQAEQLWQSAGEAVQPLLRLLKAEQANP